MYKDDRSSLASRLGGCLVITLAICVLLPVILLVYEAVGPVGSLAATTAIGCLAAAIGSYRRSRTWRSAPSLLVSTSRAGYVQVAGHAAPADNRTLRDPLTHEPCVWFGVETAKLETV